MDGIVRAIVIGGAFAGLFAWSVLAPGSMRSVMAEEPAKAATSTFTEIFPRPFDPSGLVKFGVVLGPGVSTDVQQTTIISKISHGQREYVSIITTPSGTYSSDALTSANVKYPGIDVVPEFVGRWAREAYRFVGGDWTSTTSGSITTFTFVPAPSRQS